MNQRLVCLAIVMASAQCASFALNVENYVTGMSGVIGIDFQQKTNRLIVSTNYSAGSPYNFESVSLVNQSRQQFSSVAGRQQEIYLDCISANWGPYGEGTVFSPGGAGTGEILAISPDGSTVSTLATAPVIASQYTSVRWDDWGTWNHDLIYADESAGKVWRVNSAGQMTEIFNVPGSSPEGLLVLGENARYGPWSGKVLALQNGGSTVYAISPDGTYKAYTMAFGNLEAVQVIPYAPSQAALYVSNYPNTIKKVTGFDTLPNFASHDLLFAGETAGQLYHVYWDGTQFAWSSVASGLGQIEGMVAVPEPPSITAMGAGLLLLMRRRTRRS